MEPTPQAVSPLDLGDMIRAVDRSVEADQLASKALQNFAGLNVQLAQLQQENAALKMEIAAMQKAPAPEVGNGKLPADQVASAVDGVMARPTAE